MSLLKTVLIIPTLNSGGAEKMTIDLASHLDKNKVDVTLICLYPKCNSSFDILAETREIKVIYLDKKKGFSLRSLLHLHRILNSLKPDIIHTHLSANIYVVLWKILHIRTSWIHTIHNIADKELPRIVLLLMKWVYKRKISIPIAISREIQKSIYQYYNLDSNDIILINNGIDTNFFSTIKREERGNIINLCIVARFSKQKNHTFLIDAFKEVLSSDNGHSYYLRLVGDGDLANSIKEKTIKFGISDRVIFLGNQSDVLSVLHQSDVFILSSIYEGLPLSILEAMSTGLPVIATKVGGIPDVITDGVEGILIEPNNVEQLKNAILQMGSNYNLRLRMGENAIKRANDFDISVMALKYYQAYEKIINERVQK